MIEIMNGNGDIRITPEPDENIYETIAYQLGKKIDEKRKELSKKYNDNINFVGNTLWYSSNGLHLHISYQHIFEGNIDMSIFKITLPEEYIWDETLQPRVMIAYHRGDINFTNVWKNKPISEWENCERKYDTFIC